jgi:hypothetical protein
MIVLPAVILIVAFGSWWWGDREKAALHEALHEAVFALTQGQLEGSARAPEGMRLRWADDSLQVVYAAALPNVVDDGSWTLIIDDPTVDENGIVVVRIVGGHGWVELNIRPVDGANTGVITAIGTSDVDEPRGV